MPGGIRVNGLPIRAEPIRSGSKCSHTGPFLARDMPDQDAIGFGQIAVRDGLGNGNAFAHRLGYMMRIISEPIAQSRHLGLDQAVGPDEIRIALAERRH